MWLEGGGSHARRRRRCLAEEARVAVRLSRRAEGPHQVGDRLWREVVEVARTRFVCHGREELRHGRARPGDSPRDVGKRLRIEVAQPAPRHLRIRRLPYLHRLCRRAASTHLGQRVQRHRQLVWFELGHPLGRPLGERQP